MYLLIISFIVANCVLTVFNKDNDDDDDEAPHTIILTYLLNGMNTDVTYLD